MFGHSLRFTISALILSIHASVAAETARPQAIVPPPLPHPLSNHAYALRQTADGPVWLSMSGLGAGKTWRDLQAGGLWWRPDLAQWQELPAPINGKGRIAAQLVSANGAFWFFGGYTVAADGTEVSTPDVLRVDPGSGGRPYQTQPAMPVPVDDSVALVYQDRYIYLISGWHDVGNVNLTQVFDTRSQTWSQAEPWPGAPVFGHVGAISGASLLVCGGAKIRYPQTQRNINTNPGRSYVMSEECWLGQIRSDDYRRLDWQAVPPMPGGPRYRAAAAAYPVNDSDWILFFGGTLNPYNYDGIGYNGEASQPLAQVVGFNVQEKRWACFKNLSQASMDHRNIVRLAEGSYALLGGMDEHQQVLSGIQLWRPQSLGQICPTPEQP